MNDLTVLTVDDHCAAEKIIIAYKEGRLPEGDCKSLLDQLVAHGAAEEREACAQVCEDTVTNTEEHYAPDEGPCGWCEGLETAAERIRQRGEKGDG